MTTTLILTGCTTYTEIVPSGKDTYVVAGSSELYSAAEIKVELYKKANAYCESMGKSLVPLNESTTPSYTLEQADFRFRCLYKNDPEYVRPVMESVPDITIETK